MEMTTNAINWFEIPVDEFDRAKLFYSRIFDYEMPTMDMGPIRMGFLLFEQGKGVGGAIVKGDGILPARTGTLVYLNAGDDLSAVLMRVDDAGGKVLRGKTRVAPGMGDYGRCRVSGGNRGAMHPKK